MTSKPTLATRGRASGRESELSGELERLGVPRRSVNPASVSMMLAETREAPFTRKGWLFELKYDGFRALGSRGGGKGALRYRHGSDASEIFPEITRALGALPLEDFVLDGEIVVLDEHGKPSFQRLQKRALLSRATDVARASLASPATYYAFDLLGAVGRDLRGLGVLDRKELLRKVIPSGGPLRFSDFVIEQGEALYEEVRERGLEGIMAKQADAAYRGGRSALWLKVRVDRTGDFAVVGFSLPEGSRTGFGALHLASSDGDGLVYSGRVGSGFDEAELASVRALLEPSRRKTPPCRGALPRGPRHVWVEPRLCCEVRYKEWTGEGQLRHPVFLRFRNDKGAGGSLDKPPARATPRIHLTNLTKVFWPAEGYTKGDLVEFYRAVSPWLLPFLRDRPLVLTRYPDGITGKNFFQKDSPESAPSWIRTVRTWSENAERQIDYFVCDDLDTLLYFANLGAIPLHVWSSRVTSLAHPDWTILDLDPKGAPFAHVVALARALRELCDEIDLPSFVKTSGSTGLHVLVPLGRQCTWEDSRTLAQLLSAVVVQEHPDTGTLARVVSSRGGRVYLDFLQNGHGRLLVSPYSVRPLPGAPVSTPLRWSEVGGKLRPEEFTMKTLPRRLARMKTDPLSPLLSEKPDLPGALKRLEARLGPPR